MDLDDYIKKAAPKDYKNTTSSNLDDYIKKAAPAPGYKAPEKIQQTTIEETKKPSLLKRTSQLPGKFLNTIESATARPTEDELGANKTRNTFKYLPSQLAENLPFGAGEIVKQARNEPEIISSVKIEDVLQGMVDVSKGTFASIIGTAASVAGKPLKFNLPVIGEVSNLQYNAAQRISQGEPVSKVILEEGIVNNIFGVLMLSGLGQSVFGKRPTTINKIEFKAGDAPGGIKTKNQSKSFRLYEEPIIQGSLKPEVVQKVISENPLPKGVKYNPELPTYFKITGTAKNTIKGELVQVKPSYFDVFANKFKGDIGKTPNNMVVPLISKQVSLPQLQSGKVSVIPESTPIIPSKEVLTAKVEEMIPVLKQNPSDIQVVETVKQLAQETGEKEIIQKVENTIQTAQKEVTQAQEKLNEYIEKAEQTPEKELTDPAYIPYKPARALPPERVYQNTPTSKFIIGEFEGKTYTTDSYILEFNSDVNPPSKTITIDGQKIVQPKVEVITDKAPDENAIRKIVPAEENLEKVEIVKVGQTEDGKQKVVTLEGENVSLEMQQKYFDYFSKKYPGATFKAESNEKPVVVYKGGEKVGLIMPINRGTFKKLQTTWEKPKTAQPKLSDTKVEKETPAQKKIKELEKENESLKNKELSSPRLSGGELGSLASPQGNKTIRKIIERQADAKVDDVQEVPKDFKISERAKAILESFGVPIAEKTLSSRLLGVYKPLTKKVRVQALYDITTVTHEAVHAIDDQTKFAERLIAESGKGSEIRKRLTDIYEQLYPRAKRTHKLTTRIKEGLAVFFENYFYDPASIKAEYPDLVQDFIEPTGKYYNPKFTELLDAMNQLVDDYAALTPEQRIGSRIRTGKEVIDNQSGFTFKQRLEYEVFNKFEPLKRYGKEAGVEGTWDDPYVQAFNIMNKNSLIANWVNGKETPILMSDGNFKIEKGSVKDYLDLIKNDINTFRSYLVARRIVSDNNKLIDLENTLQEMKGDMDPETIQESLEITKEIDRLTKVLNRDDFSLQDASAIIEKYADKFKEAEDIFDNINKRLIEFSVQNGLMDKELGNTYINEKGYASFRRYIEEDLTSIGTLKTSNKSKVSSFKERTGSQLDIVDPIYSQILSINEIIGKALENRLWLKVANLANKNPEISQRFEKIQSEPSMDANGNVSFPQEKQPDIIRVFKNGKREFYRAGPEFIAVMKQLRGKEFDLFTQILRIPASVFTRLTTSANPLFALGNLAVDQFSALSQTKTGFTPIVDPVKSFVKYISGDEGLKAYISMGGQRQTLAAFYDLSPDEITNKMIGGRTNVEKVSGIIDSGISILEIPANISEIATRFAEFNKAKQMSKTDSEAMFMAAEITTAFQLQGNLGGRFGQEYIKSIPYLNSIIQVLYRYGRAAKDNPKRMSTVTAGLLVAGLSFAIAIMEMGSDEQKRLLSEQPVRNLSRYMYIPSPDGKSLIRIRVPEQMGAFLGMGLLFTIQNYGGNEAKFKDYVDAFSATIPDQIQPWEPGKMITSYIPQVLKPSVQTAFNIKTYPDIAPIVPYFMENKKKSEQYNSYTSEVAKFLGKTLNISPAKTEFWVRNQFGVIGGLLMLKSPSNPIYLQEKEFVMLGRSYNRFYENRELIKKDYEDKVKNNPDKYSYNEKYEISQDKKIYTVMSDILSEIGKINQKQKELPEDVKQLTQDILIGLDGNQNMEPKIFLLKDKIYNLKQ